MDEKNDSLRYRKCFRHSRTALWGQAVGTINITANKLNLASKTGMKIIMKKIIVIKIIIMIGRNKIFC